MSSSFQIPLRLSTYVHDIKSGNQKLALKIVVEFSFVHLPKSNDRTFSVTLALNAYATFNRIIDRVLIFAKDQIKLQTVMHCKYWLCCFTLTFRILHFKI